MTTNSNTPSIACPACGVRVEQVASATLDLALWQHYHWVCRAGAHSSEMVCRNCGFVGDDVQDFISTDEVGERICPKCGSDQCFVIPEEVNDQAVAPLQAESQLTALRQERDEARAILIAIRGWDMLDCTADGPYWKRTIDAVLATGTGEAG